MCKGHELQQWYTADIRYKYENIPIISIFRNELTSPALTVMIWGMKFVPTEHAFHSPVIIDENKYNFRIPTAES